MKFQIVMLSIVALLLAGCGSDDGEIAIEEEESPVLDDPSTGHKAAGEQGAETDELLAQLVDIRIGGDGWIIAMARNADPLKGGRSSGSDRTGKTLSLNSAFRLLEEACENAPREYPPESARKTPPDDETALPIRILLRWNPDVKKCKVYAGQTLCGYDDAGFESAPDAIRQSRAAGASNAEIDASGDTPLSMVLRAVKILKGLDAAEIAFTSSYHMGDRDGAPPVRKYNGADGGGRYHPDVAVRIKGEPETGWIFVQNLLRRCAAMGIYKIYMSAGDGEDLQAFLPIHAPPDAGIEREIFENETEIGIDEPPIEDPAPGEDGAGGEADEAWDKPVERWGGSAIGIGGSMGVFSERFNRGTNLRSGGGGDNTEAAVLRGLTWLKKHQNPDGKWSCRNFAKNCGDGACGGAGACDGYDTGLTGLALLAFLGAGKTHKHGEFKQTVKNGLKALKDWQTPDGCFGPKTDDGQWIYNHAICTTAAAEACALTGRSPLLCGMAQKAVDFLVACQNPGSGWRYGVRPGRSDTSCTGWAALALKTARMSGLEAPQECYDGAIAWFDSVTDDTYYRTGYTSKGDAGARLASASATHPPGEAMTAVAVLSRIFLRGKKAVKMPEVLGGANLIKQNPPSWDAGAIDMYYWYFGSQVMFQLGGHYWKGWNVRMKNALIPAQKRGGCADGSWDPAGTWGGAGGRVYSTAICTLTLEVYYRHKRALR